MITKAMKWTTNNNGMYAIALTGSHVHMQRRQQQQKNQMAPKYSQFYFRLTFLSLGWFFFL